MIAISPIFFLSFEFIAGEGGDEGGGRREGQEGGGEGDDGGGEGGGQDGEGGEDAGGEQGSGQDGEGGDDTGGQQGSGQDGEGGGRTGLRTPSLPWLSTLPYIAGLLLLLILLVLVVALLYLLAKWLRKCRLEGLRRHWGGFWSFVAATFRAWWQATVGRWRAFIAAVRGLFRRIRRGRTTKDGLPKDRFADVFRNRALAAGLTPAQMATHVYEAFLAYAELVGCARKDHETPLEYLGRMPDRVRVQRDDAESLTKLYVRAAYTSDELDQEHVGVLRGIWERLQEPIDDALRAHRAEARLVRQRA